MNFIKHSGLKIQELMRMFMVLLFATGFSIEVGAQSVIGLIPNAQKDIAGNGLQAILNTEASLLYGMPFELSMDVSMTGTTAEEAPHFNEWGSAILTSGTSPFDTPTNGIQIYLRCKGNSGAQLVITANRQAFYFDNVKYNTDNFHVSLIQSNGQLTIEVTNNATNTGTAEQANKIVRYTRTMMFNQIDKFSYAIPTGMNVSNLSLGVRTEDITNYTNNIMPKGVGYLTQEARDYFTSIFEGNGTTEEKLNAYKQFISASKTGIDINGKQSYEQPDPGKVYMIRGVCQDNSYYLIREENNVDHSSVRFDLNASAPNMGDFQQLFKYLWAPRTKSNGKTALYHATGTGQYLAHDGITDFSSELAAAPEWNISLGTEIGRMALQGTFSNGTRYMAMNRQGTKVGDWPTNGGVYSSKQNDNNWSTDFIFEEVPFLVPYDLVIKGLNESTAKTIQVRYRQKLEDGSHSTAEPGDPNAGIVSDITAGGIVFISKDYEEAVGVCRLSVSDFTPTQVSGYISFVSIGNGNITIEYTQFGAMKDKALAQLNAAQSRLTKFAAGALFTQDAITTAKDKITVAEGIVSSDAARACQMLEEAMSQFYQTIDGRYVFLTSSNKVLSTNTQTNLVARDKATEATGDYYGVYQLHYVSGGAYQLRNAYENNYVGQTTSATNVNSAATTTASRWRGTYSFDVLSGKETEAEAYNMTCTNGAANTILGVSGNSIIKVSDENKEANLWDIRLVDVKTYATAYQTAAAAVSNNIGFAPSKSIKDALDAAITACPDRASSPSVTQETTLAEAINHYIDHKDDINKPANGQFITFQNRASSTTYIGENLYEMKAAATLDLGCVWETVIDGDRYYFRNLKSGMYMGKVTQSTIGRLTIKNDGANRQEIDIIAAPGRAQDEGYVALHEMGTNNSRSYIHYASSGRNDIVGWESTNNASHWTINAVDDATLISYLQTATANVKSQLTTDIATYNTLTSNGTANIPGNYEKSQHVIDAANTAASVAWPGSATKEQALEAYTNAVAAFNTFTTAGNPVENNEMFLIKTSIELNDQNGAHPAKYFVTQVLDDYTGNANGGSITNGIQSSDSDDFYLFTLWQLIKDGEYYKLYNFYTGHYLSKDRSMSDDNHNRYGLTTNPDDAAAFTVTPQHGCFVSFHLSNYDEMNDGYLNMITTPAGSRTMFGFGSNNIVTGEAGRMLFELEPSTTEHYERCLNSMLEYPIGEGIGKYTDVSNKYEQERYDVKNIIDNKGSYSDEQYATALKDAAKEFAPILAGLRINLPEAGKYYRIYSKLTSQPESRYYVSNEDPQNYAAITTNAGGDAIKSNQATVFYFDGTRLLSYGNGYYIGNGSTPWTMGGVGQSYEFDFANTGYKNKGCYSIKPRGRSYLYNNNTQLNGWSSAFNERCEWYLEEVTELPIAINNINGIGYGTLMSGRTMQIPDDVNCYTAKFINIEDQENVTGSIKLSKIRDGILPANVPVLIMIENYDGSQKYFTEPAEAPAKSDEQYAIQYEDNIFSGTLETIYSGYTPGYYKQYTLQKPADKEVGFHRYTGSTLRGFRTYLDYDKVNPTASKFAFFAFDDEEEDDINTNISVPQAAHANDGIIYDLSGRRVIAPQRGIYIVNGKKIVITK